MSCTVRRGMCQSRSGERVMHRVAGPILIAFLSFIALPAAALAQLPKPTSKLIVPGASIGGVRQGMSLAAVRKAWGPGGISQTGGACRVGQGACIWTGASSKERALLRIADNGTVAGVTIMGGPASPLARLKTSQGFGLGTKLAALKKAYPGVLPSPAGLVDPDGTGSVFVVKKTAFFISRSNGTVIGIGIASS